MQQRKRYSEELGFSRDTRKNAPQNSNNSFVVMT